MRFWISMAIVSAFFLGLTLGEAHHSRRDDARRDFTFHWNQAVCGQGRCQEIAR